MPVGNRVIGTQDCDDCGRTVELRVNKSGNVYWHCPGDSGSAGCNGERRHGPEISAKMIAEAEKNESEVESKEPENVEAQEVDTSEIVSAKPDTGAKPDDGAEPAAEKHWTDEAYGGG